MVKCDKSRHKFCHTISVDLVYSSSPKLWEGDRKSMKGEGGREAGYPWEQEPGEIVQNNFVTLCYRKTTETRTTMGSRLGGGGSRSAK